MPIDYASLRLIWWVLLGVLLIGFAIMDGFDIGTAICLPFIARNDIERRVVINTVGPVWEGNQVWFILGGGAVFAAWPFLYAVSFSGFYTAMFVVLLAFILRPVAFKYRSKINAPLWRKTWDIILALTGFVIALILGVAVGNVLQGVPFHFDTSLRVFYTGTFWQLLNPFALLCGVLSVTMLTQHGALYCAIKTEDPIMKRASRWARGMGLGTLFLFLIGGVWVALALKGYVLETALPHDGPSNPLKKAVELQQGAWMNNYERYRLLALAPLLGVFATFLAIISVKKPKFAFVASSLGIAGIISTVGVSMYPFILPSSEDLKSSLLVWDASSSHLTLTIMLASVILFLPIIIAYTSWVYTVLRGKITTQDITQHSDTHY